MMLQILPPDFEYATEAVIVNNNQVLSSAFLTSILFLVFIFILFLGIKVFKNTHKSIAVKPKNLAKYSFQS